MSGRLRDEIKQSKPFPTLETEVVLNLIRTTDQLTRVIADMLKPVDLSMTQYNVLRILKGAGEQGLACSEIADRMVTRDPDITRLLDRLEKRELVRRARSVEDRRVVNVQITREGLKLVVSIETPILEAGKKQLAHVGEKRLKELIDLLELARSKE
jgi:DNA-binding MarR family transcriptional regulator